MQMRHQFGNFRVGIDQALRHLFRMRSGVTDALDAGNLRSVFEQEGEVGNLGFTGCAHAVSRASRNLPQIGVHVLPEQCHFFHALLRETGDFRQHILKPARDFGTARIRHYAERAVFAAPFHDRHKRRHAVNFSRWQVIKFFDFGKRNIDLRFTSALAPGDQFGQAMQSLRAEHHVNVRCTRHDGRALLAGDAAADADHQIRIEQFQFTRTAEIGEHFLLRLLAHRAGVEQDHVGLTRVSRFGQAVGGMEHISHFVRVVLVHLTAEGLDVELAGRGGDLRGVARRRICASVRQRAGLIARLVTRRGESHNVQGAVVETGLRGSRR